MRKFLICFQRETKTLRNVFGPSEKDGFGRHAIEAVIDFDGGKLFAVEGEHLLVGELFRVEGTFPLFVGVAGSADAECAGAWNGSLR